MAKIIIHNLGPIKDCTMELNQFCVVTGAQASGKSTIAKTVFFFRTIKNDCMSLLIKNAGNQDMQAPLIDLLSQKLRSKFMQTFGSSWGMEMDLHLRYEYGKDTFIDITLVKSTYPNSPNYIYIRFSDNIVALLKNLSSITFDKEVIERRLNSAFYDEQETIFIPAGRSTITLLTSQLSYLFLLLDDSQKQSIDYCTQNYMERILQLKPLFSEGIQGMLYKKMSVSGSRLNEKLLNRMIRSIDHVLKGSYRYADGEERLQLNQRHYVKINYTSSGQQEAVWILNLLFYYVLENRKIYLILEEPESHLFPEAQAEMAKLMALFSSAGNSIMVTTHSPYILGALNNQLYAGELSAKGEKMASRIIAKEEQLSIGSLSAYYTEHGGFRSIVDSETRLIDNAVIDGISECINEQNEKLLRIEFSK